MSSRPDDPRNIGPGARPGRRWELAPNVHHEELANVCDKWEQRGYDIFAVLPAGVMGGGAYAAVLVRRRDA